MVKWQEVIRGKVFQHSYYLKILQSYYFTSYGLFLTPKLQFFPADG